MHYESFWGEQRQEEGLEGAVGRGFGDHLRSLVTAAGRRGAGAGAGAVTTDTGGVTLGVGGWVGVWGGDLGFFFGVTLCPTPL